MSNDEIIWRMSPRESVPEFLLGREQQLLINDAFSVEKNRLKRGDVAIGYLQSRENQQYNPPCLLMLSEDKAAETLSWLRVYAGETWPLSQYVRLVSDKDWSNFSVSSNVKCQLREDVWASVILGEVIAQGETDMGIETIPLSRAGACFSMAVAQAKCSFGSDIAMKECVSRLRQIESDRHFVRRPVTVEELLPIWSLAGAAPTTIGSTSIGSTVMMVVDEVRHYMSDWTSSLVKHVSVDLRDAPEFASDSIEERVRAFNRLSGLLVGLSGQEAKNPFAPVLLAGAAFLVGRGTSHEFLLRRVNRRYPSVSAWFGLIAAIAGPASWDPHWSRAVKGIERQVRSRFEWAEISGFDLGWHEYRWMASVFDNSDVFASLPKLLPRVLSVEVVPGAMCQFRFSGGAAENEKRQQFVDRSHEKELVATLEKFVSLAERARQLLDSDNMPVQQNLDLVGSNDIVRPVTKRRNRPRMSSSKA